MLAVRSQWTTPPLPRGGHEVVVDDDVGETEGCSGTVVVVGSDQQTREAVVGVDLAPNQANAELARQVYGKSIGGVDLP